jgi:hypothetical protein
MFGAFTVGDRGLAAEGSPVLLEEAVAVLGGYGPKSDTPVEGPKGLLEDAVRGCVAVLETGPKTPPESSILYNAESEKTLEGATVEEETVAESDGVEPISDSPLERTETVLRGDGRCSAEVSEEPPETAPEVAVL